MKGDIVYILRKECMFDYDKSNEERIFASHDDAVAEMKRLCTIYQDDLTSIGGICNYQESNNRCMVREKFDIGGERFYLLITINTIVIE